MPLPSLKNKKSNLVMSGTSGRAFDWGIFRRLYGRSKPYSKSFFITALLVILISLLSPVRPEQLRHIIDDEVPNGNYHGVVIYTCWFIGFLIIEASTKQLKVNIALVTNFF